MPFCINIYSKSIENKAKANEMTPKKLVKIQEGIGLTNKEMARRLWVSPETYLRWRSRKSFDDRLAQRIKGAVRSMVIDQLAVVEKIKAELTKTGEQHE